MVQFHPHRTTVTRDSLLSAPMQTSFTDTDVVRLRGTVGLDKYGVAQSVTLDNSPKLANSLQYNMPDELVGSGFDRMNALYRGGNDHIV
jgi:hypothetical protein